MSNKEVSELLDQLFNTAKMQFGTAIDARWFYPDTNCPGCGGKVKKMKFKGQDSLSLNAFIYREHKVLIGYLLCGKCARYIIKESETNPFGQLPIHAEIEKNLKQAYIKQLGH